MPPELYSHHRRHERRPVWSEAEVVILGEDGAEIDAGTALVADMSLGGLKLVHLDLRRGLLPISGFRIRFRMTGGEYQGIDGVGRPVRCEYGMEPAVGLELENLSLEVSAAG